LCKWNCASQLLVLVVEPSSSHVCGNKLYLSSTHNSFPRSI